MLDFINKISDKPEWDRKVFDEAIVSKWEAEATPYNDELKDVYLSKQMFEYCILELREKALMYQEKGLVAVLDAEVTVVKSDTAVPEALRQALIDRIRPLEDVPEYLKDWHPHSNKTVLDLVHPSLFPVVFGRTRALPTGRVPLEDCATYIGKGELVPAHDTYDYEIADSWSNEAWDLSAWGKFQWLPTQIDFTPDGHAKIASYINNLHPQDHGDLYSVLEKLVDRAIPLWNECLSWFHDRTRINPGELNDNNWDVPVFPERAKHPDSQLPGDEPWSSRQDRLWAGDHGLDAAYDRWWHAHRVLKPIEPRAFAPFSTTTSRPGARPVDLKADFAGAAGGLQVIFKLATIHLTPDNPSYAASNWHVEGSLNERICATAIFYFNSHNVTASRLAFRHSVDTEDLTMKPEQYEHSSLRAYYGVGQEEAAVQDLGHVATRQGRMVAFPNVLQHRVEPFELEDPTKPGHRKILAMFLVDPRQRVLSTQNVPPQRRDWWVREVREVASGTRLGRLPEVVWQRVVAWVDAIEGQDEAVWSWEEALGVREELMTERGKMGEELEGIVMERVFNFCEH